MARMGGSRHVKALAAPPIQRIPRKERPWTVKPSPGPHPVDQSLPLLIAVRDLLKLAETNREARKVIASGEIKVDGKVVKDYKWPVGVMDVLEIPRVNDYYRALPDPRGTIRLVKIPKEEAQLKIVRVEGVTTVKGGHFELHLSGGRNIMVKVQDPTKAGQLPYKPLDGLLITLPDSSIKDHVEFKVGNIALVVWGKNVGRYGKITSIARGWGWKRSVITLEDSSGNRFETSLGNVYVVGRDRPLIMIGG
ncbi:MAG: 30S ribosomal protein S4e [Acidilobus sp.]